MKSRRFFWTAIPVLLIAVGCGWCIAQAQQATEQPASATTTIKAETRLVLVDVIVTDKKGDYIHDLSQKDFKVFEDDQEQKIKTFSFEQGAAPSEQTKRHLVLFFDDDSMKAPDQTRARAAAAKFLDANGGPGRFFAVIDYAGTMRITQNFTDDMARLKQVVGQPKLSTDSNLNASLGSPVFASYDAYTNRNVLLALRSVARSMSTLPGRKSLIWLTSGMAMNSDIQAEMTALISACNGSNVAVYPVDVRGLTGPIQGRQTSPRLRGDDLEFSYARFEAGDDETPRLVYVAQKGGTGGGGGGKTGGSTGTTGNTGGHPGNTGGRTYTQPVNQTPFTSPVNAPGTILLPPLQGSVSTTQQILYSVATGTGGFVIANNNDLLAGLEKIGKDSNQYYVLGYTPPSPEDGSCHALKVKVVNPSGAQVRGRTGYCAVKSTDFLANKPIAKQLEAHALGSEAGDITGSAAAPFFYTSPGTARVNLALDLAGSSIKFNKDKGTYHATLNILGMATKADGTVAARFSDALDLELDKKQLDDFASKPYHYENQFYVASGQYTLNVAVNTGDKYGKFEVPLVVDPYDKAQFSMSGLALSKEFHKVSDMSENLDALLLQDRTPLVTQGLQLVPTGENTFKKSDRAAIYLEVYEPVVADSTAPKVSLKVSILDQKTGKSELEAGVPDTGASVIPGNPMIPMGVPLPLSTLPPGTYVVELSATDTAGHSTTARKAVFSVE
jgi:VWFA-related protein